MAEGSGKTPSRQPPRQALHLARQLQSGIPTQAGKHFEPLRHCLDKVAGEEAGVVSPDLRLIAPRPDARRKPPLPCACCHSPMRHFKSCARVQVQQQAAPPMNSCSAAASPPTDAP